MSKILVVDDEPGYCEELTLSLAHVGHEVQTAVSGRQAIDLGARYRPDVLVADWMLRNSIHGLHVSQVLRTIHPEVQTVLITGFASQHLKAEAERFRVFDFIEKPFSLDHLHAAVRDAARAGPRPDAPVRIGFVETDAAGAITFANDTARDILGQTPVGRDATHLDRALPDVGPEDLKDAAERWVQVVPAGELPAAWDIRIKRFDDPERRLIALIPTDKRYLRDHPILNMLLEVEESALARWPLKGRALFVDDDELVRRVIVAELQRLGCVCHAAETGEVGLRLLERDPEIDVIILDHDVPGTDTAEFARSVQATRPDAILVGTSGHYLRNEFLAMGVDRFLLKPWRIDDLVSVLTNRIGNCVDCGLALPLKRVTPGEPADRWVCCGCGARYLAVFEEAAPEEVRRHVQPA
ncbi:MAG: response regulator [Phycisphaerales bacterium]|nr:MAG: response regulator [Phycisphaerales bacterium]